MGSGAYGWGMVKTYRGPGVKEISGNELEDYMKKMGVWPDKENEGGEEGEDGWPV